MERSEINNNTKETIDYDAGKVDDIIFPIDSSWLDPIFNNTNEEDNRMNNKVKINAGNVNAPADKLMPDNSSNLKNNTSALSYHQN